MGLLARAVAVFVLAAASAAGAAEAEAPPAADDDLIRRLFADGGMDATWIAPVAREQLTPQLIALVVSRVTEIAGPMETVAPEGHSWLVTLENGFTTVVLSRDEYGLVNGLFFTEVIPRDLTLEQAVAAIAALPGETAVLVLGGSEILAERNADAELLIGSTFKLAVLQAVEDAVESGSLGWDQVIRYDAAEGSVSSGMLQAYPEGHPITVASLAAMMISLSDNTATDALINLVGRDRVEAAAGTEPILKTAEYFKLKADAALYGRYLEAGLGERRQILEELAVTPLPHVGAVANGRVAHGWRMSVRRLCALMDGVADLGIMSINTGGIAEADWERIAFKGGNDIGVTNLTYMLTPPQGPSFCVSLTWNGADHFDDAEFSGFANHLFHVLRTRG